VQSNYKPSIDKIEYSFPELQVVETVRKWAGSMALSDQLDSPQLSIEGIAIGCPS
jgi:hypothetical protein